MNPTLATLAAMALTAMLAAPASAQQAQASKAGAAAPAVAAATTGPVEVTVLAINDFHGNLQPPPGGVTIADPADRTKHITVPAGGAEHMATLVRQLRAGKKHSIFVAAGDLIGASPFLSAMFHDEPTIEALSMMGLEVAAVGNHEFDEGRDELLRMQFGGCHPTENCRGPHAFAGATFQYLAASTFDTSTGKTILPPFQIKAFDGIPVAFIGLTLKGTPMSVSPSGVAGLEFRDEAETVNALVPRLKGAGIEAIVVLIHEGGFPTGDYNECPGISGPIVDIVKKFDRAVDVVVSGHTHRAYTCTIDGRLVTSGDKYGTIVTEISLEIDRTTRDIISTKSNNHIVHTDRYAKEPTQTALLAAYDKVAGPIANRRAGAVTATLSRMPNAAGESALGDIIADAQLAATRAAKDGGAEIAMTNPGGIRGDIMMTADGAVSYGDVFASQPFRNQLVTMTLTGNQIRIALEQQWTDPNRPRILQVSQNFRYSWDAAKPAGSRIPPQSIMLNGVPLDPDKAYRVTVNGFLADGGDGFVVFKGGGAPQVGVYDVDALDAWFKASSPVAPGPMNRITRLN